MKLLIVTPWPLSTFGGAQRLAREIAVALASAGGFDVAIAAGSGFPERVGEPLSLGAVREIRLPLRCRGDSRPDARAGVHQTGYLDGLEGLANQLRPDVILYTPHYSSCARQAAAVAAALHVPLALLPAIHLDHRTHTSGAARRFYRSADLIVCLS